MINALLILAVAVLGIQVLLFFLIRSRKRKLKRESIVERFNIRTRVDAWNLLSSQDLSADDRKKIEELYKQME